MAKRKKETVAGVNSQSLGSASSILHIVASIITILNFVIVIISGETSFDIPLNFDLDLAEYSTSFRVTITIILEICLASFFGFIFNYITRFYENAAALFMILLIIFALISGWISLFNIEFILLSNVQIEGGLVYAGFFVLYGLAWLIGAFFIFIHFGDDEEDRQFGIHFITAIAFVVLFIGRAIG
ncbi:hypothetical protein LCM02_11590 [Lutimonas saemankumensis]|uniref:hypothetical protein n=1 Tax=Lutimonas saemankumensis TaxID=483016 RepID=UPI001CD4C53F|nr:hypothetical protein [Lutimonas saemankumensis]MCA0933098.1 hypothetical protein [Lutimonas saemankumensis]